MESIENKSPQVESEITPEKLYALRDNLRLIARLGADVGEAQSLVLALETNFGPDANPRTIEKVEPMLRKKIEALNEILKDIPDSLEL
ncbi:MAG TPA: hypothetical protein VMT99_03465 [Candidatus Paceibacterota bacterium]|nr:hypothetical protein [Candidatus Paceibacterota bacterium]